jgi:replicative DNA helicase
MPPNKLPHNLEAEQALLGCILYDNGAFHRLDGSIRPDHFYEPFHQKLYAVIDAKVRGGALAEPITLIDHFKDDQAFKDLGGIRYFADLVDRSPPSVQALDYAQVTGHGFRGAGHRAGRAYACR